MLSNEITMQAKFLWALLLFCVLLARPCRSDEAADVTSSNASLAFRLKTLDEGFVEIKSGEKMVTVVCFVGTECPLVQLYSVRLSQMADDFRERGVQFIGIDSNRQDTVQDLRQYLQRHQLSYPLVRDEGNVVADQFGATRTPEVFVLDKNLSVTYQGRIDDQYDPGITRSAPTRQDLRIAIEETLSGKRVAVPKTEVVGCKIGKFKRDPSTAHNVAGTGNVTYCKEVSRVFQRHCVECHRKGEIGPFSLEAYEDAVGWADTSMEVIDNGRMPPWHADPNHGNFSNARFMPEADKQILRDWIAAGTPEGDLADLPEPIEYSNGWQLRREPDLIVEMRDQPYVVPAEGTVEYQYFVVDPKFTEDKWVTGAQIIPGNRSVVHHAIVFIRPPDGSEFRGIGWLTAYVPGQRLVEMPPGHARRIPAGSRLVFQMHYTVNGSVQEDTTKVGITFGDRDDVTSEVITLIGIDQEFEIPPNAANHEVSGKIRGLPKNGRVLGVAPHMHVRGKEFRLFSDRDGSSETLLQVPNYDFNWQHSYVFAKPLELEGIEQLRFKATFDNSSGNPFNPDPSQWVTWGDQTWEEMAVVFLEVAEPLDRPKSAEAPVVVQVPDSSPEREARIRKFVDDFFAQVDSNGDGVVAKAEAPLAMRGSFYRFDRNGDNIATKDEVRQLAESRIAE